MNTYLHRKLFVSEYLLCVCTICTLCALLTPLVALVVKEEEVEEESQTGFGVCFCLEVMMMLLKLFAITYAKAISGLLYSLGAKLKGFKSIIIISSHYTTFIRQTS